MRAAGCWLFALHDISHARGIQGKNGVILHDYWTSQVSYVLTGDNMAVEDLYSKCLSGESVVTLGEDGGTSSFKSATTSESLGE